MTPITTTLRKDCIDVHAELPLELRATEQDLPERFSGPPKDSHGRLVQITGSPDNNGRYPVKEVHVPYNTFPEIWLHWSLFEDPELAVEPVVANESKPKVKRGATKTKT